VASVPTSSILEGAFHTPSNFVHETRLPPGIERSVSQAAQVVSKRAIVIFPENADLGEVERLRQRFDPLASAIPAHITLVFPFELELSTDELRTHVQHTIGECRAFPVRLTTITGHEDEYLFLGVAAGRDRIVDLHDRLYTGPLAPHLSHAHTYAPHMTVGRLPDRPAFLAALGETGNTTLAIDADVRTVSACRLDDTGRWIAESTVSLRD